MRRSAAVVGEDTRPRGGGPGVARAPVCWVDVAVTPATRHQARLHAVCVTPTMITLRTPHSHPDHSHCLHGLVSTGMGDRLRAGVPSRYVTSQLGQLSLASLQGRWIIQ